MKAIVTGASGMVGKAVLLECLKNDEVEKVLIINRKSIGISHEKLEEVIHSDFSDFTSLHDIISGYNACFLCMGVSAAGLSEEQYKTLTYDYTLSLAKAMLDINPDSSACYISGAGTDSSEQGRIMWARVKGKTENALLNLAFKSAYMFRPGYIQPMDGLKSKTKLYNIIYLFTKPFYFLLKRLPNTITNTRTLGRAMVNVVVNGSDKKILNPRDINDLGR